MACCDSLNTKCNEIVTIGYIEELITSGTGTTGSQLIQSSANCNSYITVDVNAVKQKMVETCCGLSQNDYKSYAPTYAEIINGSFIPYHKDGSGTYAWFGNQDGLYVNPSSYNGVNYDGSNKDSSCCGGGTALVRKQDLKVVYTRCNGYSENISSTAGTEVCGGDVTFTNTLSLKKYVKSLNSDCNTYNTSESTASYNNVYNSSYVHVTGGTGNTIHFSQNGELPTSEECSSVSIETSPNTVNRTSAMIFRGCTCNTSNHTVSQVGTNLSIQWTSQNCDDEEDYISYEGDEAFTAATITYGVGYTIPSEGGLWFTVSRWDDVIQDYEVIDTYSGDTYIKINEDENLVLDIIENDTNENHFIDVYVKMTFCDTEQTYTCHYCQGYNGDEPTPGGESSDDCNSGLMSLYPIAPCGMEAF